jgi:hypothetical protein
MVASISPKATSNGNISNRNFFLPSLGFHLSILYSTCLATHDHLTSKNHSLFRVSNRKHLQNTNINPYLGNSQPEFKADQHAQAQAKAQEKAQAQAQAQQLLSFSTFISSRREDHHCLDVHFPLSWPLTLNGCCRRQGGSDRHRPRIQGSRQDANGPLAPPPSSTWLVE